MRGDDAIGIEIVEMLTGKTPRNVRVFNCQIVPENFIEKIKQFNPTHVLMIDAADFKAEPGEVKLISPEEISGLTISTHSIPLNVLAEIIQETMHAKVLILGIQPETTEFGSKITEKIQKAAERLTDELLKLLKEHFK